MASYEVATKKVGAHQKKLAKDTVDTVTFADPLQAIEITSDGTAALYVTVDGTDPTVAGDHTYELPAFPSVRVIDVPLTSARGATTIKLISAGTPTYSAAKERE